METNTAKKIAPGYYSYRGAHISFIAGRGWAVRMAGEFAANDIVRTLKIAKEGVDHWVDHPEEYAG